MTNQEFASKLRTLADKWEQLPEQKNTPLLFVENSRKEDAVAIVKGIGGHWTKTITNPDHPYARVVYASRETGLEVSLYRDSLCRIIRPAQPAQYECEPLLSPDEEAEILEPTA